MAAGSCRALVHCWCLDSRSCWRSGVFLRSAGEQSGSEGEARDWVRQKGRGVGRKNWQAGEEKLPFLLWK